MREKTCPECRSKKIEVNRYELICKGCNLILDDFAIGQILTERSNEFNSNFSFNPDRGLSTQISKSQSRQMNRIRWIQNKLTYADPKLRGLAIAFNEIRRVSSLLKLPLPVQKTAAYFYRIAKKKKITNGRKIEMTVAGILVLAARIHKIPLKIEEVSKTSDIDLKGIKKTVYILKRELEIRTEPENPNQQLIKLISIFKLNKKLQKKAEIIFQTYLRQYGGRPISSAAAAVYLASQNQPTPLTQMEIAKSARISEVTLRNCCRLNKF